MDNRDKIRKAIEMASIAHDGQYDKGGVPYINHPLHLFSKFHTLECKIVALLHDVIEDSFQYTLGDIEREFGVKIRNAVDAITKRGGEPYQIYLDRVKDNEIARLVKVEDLRHNLDRSRVKTITDHYITREAKYMKALEFLLEGMV